MRSLNEVIGKFRHLAGKYPNSRYKGLVQIFDYLITKGYTIHTSRIG